MPTLEENLLEYNPWWAWSETNRGIGMEDDPHIKRVRKSAFQWSPPALETVPLAFGDTHTLRGPRQAGKTTTLKRMIKRLLESGERRILYFAFDYATSPEFVENVIRTAKAIHPSPKGPWYLFLDEITAVPDWQLGIKVSWDRGLTSDDSIVLTASSAHDLKRGAERLPGRRGRGGDYVQLPMSFRDFCTSVHGTELRDEPILAEEFITEKGQKLSHRMLGMQSELKRAFAAYLRVGGFPAAVNDYVQNGAVSPEVVQTLWNIIVGDINKSAREPMAALRLLQATGNSLGSMLSWVTASRAMGFEKPDTARQYAEYLAEIYVLLAVYFWDTDKQRLEPRKQRKIYWMDPIIGEMPGVLIPGSKAPPEDGLVENAVATGLFRSSAQTLIQANAVPGSVAYWRSSNDREIDFVVPQVSDLAQERFPIEVKGDNSSEISAARRAIRLTYGRGLVLSRTVFDWQQDVAVIPVWAFLAGLSEQPLRRITIG